MGLIFSVIKRAARPYIAGTDLADALAVAEEARTRGLAVTLCYWHDAEDPPTLAQARYSGLIEAIATAGLDAHLSMKVPALHGGPELISELMAEARAAGVPVDIDAHGPDQAEADYAVAERLGGDGLGIAVPGRWAFAPALADRAIDLGLRVRVVKGQWADPAAPDLDPATGYLAVINRLAGRVRAAGVATHDPALAETAIRRLLEASTPVEQELLYGLPMQAPVAVARALGVSTRVYIPFGTAWVPYSMRKAFTSPGTVSRFLRDLAHGRRDGLPKSA